MSEKTDSVQIGGQRGGVIMPEGEARLAPVLGHAMIPFMDAGKFKRLLNELGGRSGYGHCLRCGDSWAWKQSHVTNYGSAGMGCYPLCEECWRQLGRVERLRYYWRLLESWEQYEEDLWVDIVEAVLSEEGKIFDDPRK